MIPVIAVSPNGEWMVTGSAFKPARLWNMQDPSNPIPSEIPNSGNFLAQVAFSPDGRWLATSSWYKDATVWDLSAKSPLSSPYLTPGGSVPVAFSRDSRWCVAGTRVIDLLAKSTKMELRGHTLGVSSVAITSDNRWVVTGGLDGTARMWEMNLDTLVARARKTIGRELSPKERELYSVPAKNDEANVP